MLDGQSNKDDRTMALPQARVTVDSMAEFQVLTHEYGAEYGGSTGVIINAITKSGTNQFHGRDVLLLPGREAERPELLPERQGEAGQRLEAGRLQHRRADPPEQGVLLLQLREDRPQFRDQRPVPAGSGAAGASYSTSYDVNLTNYFGRVDYQVTPSNLVNFRVVYGPNDGIGENAEIERTTRDGFRYERAPGELLWTGQWNWVIGNNKVNEFKVGTTQRGPLDRRPPDLQSTGFDSIPFDIETGGWPGLAMPA